MRLTEIRTMLDREPFRPFRICMSDGSGHDIEKPEFVFLTRSTVMIGVLPDDEGFPDRAVHLDTLHISRLEPIEPAA